MPTLRAGLQGISGRPAFRVGQEPRFAAGRARCLVDLSTYAAQESRQLASARPAGRILAEASRIVGHDGGGTLDANRGSLWRSFMRLVITLPRALGDDLDRARGMTANEYTTLMHLSEAKRTPA